MPKSTAWILKSYHLQTKALFAQHTSKEENNTDHEKGMLKIPSNTVFVLVFCLNVIKIKS